MAAIEEVPDYGVEPEEVKEAVRKLLTEYLSSTDASEETGIHNLTAAVTAPKKDGKPRIVPYFYEFWEGVLEVVASTSEESQQRKIAHLIVELSKFKAGVSELYDGDKVDIWTAMPKYKESIHELMRSIGTQKEEGRKQIANLNAFMAYTTPRWDFRQYGLGALSALENTKNLDYWIPIAARWIDLHGELFLGAGWNNEREYQTILRVAPGPLLHGASPDLSKARWDFWTGRLADLQRSGQVKDETKPIIERMLSRMIEITQGLKSEDEDEEDGEEEETDDIL